MIDIFKIGHGANVMEYVNNVANEISLAIEKEKEVYGNWLEEFLKLKRNNNNIEKDLNMKQICFQEEIEKLNEELDFLENEINKETDLIKLEENSLESLISERSILKKELRSKYKETELTRQQAVPTEQDKCKLGKAKIKMVLYKEATGVRFDYAVPESEFIQGFMKGNEEKGPKFFRHKGNMIENEIHDKLWQQLSALTLNETD